MQYALPFLCCEFFGKVCLDYLLMDNLNMDFHESSLHKNLYLKMKWGILVTG